MNKKISKGDGFSLVEVTIALGIGSFCLLTLMALLPIGVQRYQDGSKQSDMVNLATMVMRDLQATPSSGTSMRFNFSVPAANGTADVNPQIRYVDASGNVATGNARIFRINVAFTPPGAGLRTATTSRIWITWPALADAATTTWPTKYVDMFETTVALNRN